MMRKPIGLLSSLLVSVSLSCSQGTEQPDPRSGAQSDPQGVAKSIALNTVETNMQSPPPEVSNDVFPAPSQTPGLPIPSNFGHDCGQGSAGYGFLFPTCHNAADRFCSDRNAEYPGCGIVHCVQGFDPARAMYWHTFNWTCEGGQFCTYNWGAKKCTPTAKCPPERQGNGAWPPAVEALMELGCSGSPRCVKWTAVKNEAPCRNWKSFQTKPCVRSRPVYTNVCVRSGLFGRCREWESRQTGEECTQWTIKKRCAQWTKKGVGPCLEWNDGQYDGPGETALLPPGSIQVPSPGECARLAMKPDYGPMSSSGPNNVTSDTPPYPTGAIADPPIASNPSAPPRDPKFQGGWVNDPVKKPRDNCMLCCEVQRNFWGRSDYLVDPKCNYKQTCQRRDDFKKACLAECDKWVP